MLIGEISYQQKDKIGREPFCIACLNILDQDFPGFNFFGDTIETCVDLALFYTIFHIRDEPVFHFCAKICFLVNNRNMGIMPV